MKRINMLAAALVLAACHESPIGVSEEVGRAGAIVITEGVPAPKFEQVWRMAHSVLQDAAPSLGGSTTTPVSLNGTGCTASPAQLVTISYTLTGNQQSPASFEVYTTWNYNGTEFVGSNATTVNTPAKTGGGSVQYQVQISIGNTSGEGTGAASFVVAPFNLVTNVSDPAGQRLTLDASSSATIYVAFNDCTPINTAPSITVPSDITEEATGPSGAIVNFAVTASDAEDGDLTGSVICTPASGSTFPLGTTTVNCSVTDEGGLTAEDSFEITVEDTTPPEISGAPTDLVTLIAQNINGATYDVSGITASDLVDGTVAVNCLPSPATFAIGQTGEVTCTAIDVADNDAEVSFYVFVTLDFTGASGFFTPLRMAAPFSSHKLGSTVPHKLPAPRYADGSLATDLASGLRLELVNVTNSITVDVVADADYSAGSTAWRWDSDAQQYIFNLKSPKSGWPQGTWTTTVSYAGLTLATTTLAFTK